MDFDERVIALLGAFARSFPCLGPGHLSLLLSVSRHPGTPLEHHAAAVGVGRATALFNARDLEKLGAVTIAGPAVELTAEGARRLAGVLGARMP